MRLTSFTDFALRALMRLAGEPARSFATNEIAAEFGISRNHLAKVVRDLADGGFITPSAAPAAASRWRGRRNRSRSARSCARWKAAGAGRMFSRGWRRLRADAALPAEGKARRRARGLHARARRHDAGGMRLSRAAAEQPRRARRERVPHEADRIREWRCGDRRIDRRRRPRPCAAAAPQEMRAGKITSLSERGIDADQGRHRLTFFSEHRRFRLVVDDSGTIVQRSALDFGDSSLPKSVRKPGG